MHVGRFLSVYRVSATVGRLIGADWLMIVIQSPTTTRRKSETKKTWQEGDKREQMEKGKMEGGVVLRGACEEIGCLLVSKDIETKELSYFWPV